ncbi:2-hydroxyacid dehydrogenase [Roseinatronobacter bogoriensis]|uniref:Glyoxylate/hydroxypyruvate reductase A n=1 Tax=Roseinatronobacter bogoriensis subsp. barguzinensis TaxID=441209 RepID=A0A2K8KAH7_9RHOB|nr:MULTISPECIES: glyoxylate/hydroxypyruvate reductase A [Rhodobaca]ATX66452.1 glyoxylate/hydroxypyruvate reductase A [Rhodobaca barguzinensis]MBB4207597.1 glyoxylate/hydroxypyruvate reductase A [Rhodobaca bogoriensis DSM 18756]TDW40096.1 glyoxylate/hydroxypyruvate reductase A [Rhodobaca barguzinensis]TDY70752.1 glyoxylate/hydroxypyruvate reductase A [Rhodobaca bogoriensis DSM 18756]
MTLTVLFAAGDAAFAEYQQPLRDAFVHHGLKVALVTDAAPADVDYIVYSPASTLRDFTPYTRCKAVLNLWAGVEKIVGNPTLTQPLARMVDPALTRGMVEYVCGHVLRYHLGMDAYISAPAGQWIAQEPPLAPERVVGILGLGELGRACADALVRLGFTVEGWSSRPKDVPDVTCHHGAEGFNLLLQRSDILVTLLPLTSQTENVLDAEAFAQMRDGSWFINPGRGALIDDDALLDAIDSGKIKGATLDVFRIEPLPADHPFWATPNITITPHIAATTRAESASNVIASNIARVEAGQTLLHKVDQQRGY